MTIDKFFVINSSTGEEFFGETFFKNDNAEGKLKIVVAMSGGVDSSTTAAMLKSEGHEVVGITLSMRNTKHTCHMSENSIRDAKQMAEKLRIQHYILECSDIFVTEVMQRFASSYVKGETPLPCAICNKKIKFGGLLSIAKKFGADKLATGHYARILYSDEGVELHKGEDLTKDQSYFLFLLNQEQLSSILFPLGDITKKETRQRSKQYNLEIENKEESQDVCFLKDGNYREIVQKLRPEACKSGNIINKAGEVLGTHNGIANYTIGQRKGISIAHNEALYVIDINSDNNTITVGEKSELMSNTVIVTNINWINELYFNNIECGTPIRCTIKLRYVQQQVDADVYPNLEDKTARIFIPQGYSAITPGQACVMYQGSKLLGGGWIAKSQDNIKHTG